MSAVSKSMHVNTFASEPEPARCATPRSLCHAEAFPAGHDGRKGTLWNPTASNKNFATMGCKSLIYLYVWPRLRAGKAEGDHVKIVRSVQQSSPACGS